MTQTQQLYQENILEHYRHPLCHGHLSHVTARGPAQNPLCGDQMTVEMRIVDGILEDVAFTGSGCAISVASASMLLSTLRGKRVEELRTLCSRDVLGLLGIDVGASRIKCALLVLDAVRKAVEDQGRVHKHA